MDVQSKMKGNLLEAADCNLLGAFKSGHESSRSIFMETSNEVLCERREDLHSFDDCSWKVSLDGSIKILRKDSNPLLLNARIVL